MTPDEIRKLVKQAHPRREIVDTRDEQYAAADDAADADVSGLSHTTWKKFSRDAASAADSDAAVDLRQRFRRRPLTGAGPGGDRPDAGGAEDEGPESSGDEPRVTLQRLVRDDDQAHDAIDVLVDEDAGIIGESDSGPEDD